MNEELIVVYMQLFDEHMCRSRFPSSIRAAKCGAYTFVCGRVCARMKKYTMYTVDIKLDVCGVMQESQ